MTSRKRPDLQAAIERLTSLYEHGALIASTQPAVFLDTVTDDVTKLRDDNARLRGLLREWFDCDTVAKSADWQTRARAALGTK